MTFSWHFSLPDNADQITSSMDGVIHHKEKYQRTMFLYKKNENDNEMFKRTILSVIGSTTVNGFSMANNLSIGWNIFKSQ